MAGQGTILHGASEASYGGNTAVQIPSHASEKWA